MTKIAETYLDKIKELRMKHPLYKQQGKKIIV